MIARLLSKRGFIEVRIIFHVVRSSTKDSIAGGIDLFDRFLFFASFKAFVFLFVAILAIWRKTSGASSMFLVLITLCFIASLKKSSPVLDRTMTVDQFFNGLAPPTDMSASSDEKSMQVRHLRKTFRLIS